MSARKLHVDELLGLFERLGARLQARAAPATIYVGGGAAMALRYGASARSLTDDVDAMGIRTRAVTEEIASIAVEMGLPADWMNDRFSTFIPGERPDVGVETMTFGALTVSIASREFLLAMKMNAGRTKDWSDKKILVRDLGLTSSEAIADLVLDLYGLHTVPTIDRDDMRLDAMRVLRAIRREDPTWLSDTDDPDRMPSDGSTGTSDGL